MSSLGTAMQAQPWQASAGLPGIEKYETYQKDPRNLTPMQNTQVPELPTPGPWSNSRAPMPPMGYWERRWESQLPGIEAQYQDTHGLSEPWSDMERPRDPRNATIAPTRGTETSGPQMLQFERPFGQSFAKRFMVGQHSSRATGPQFGWQAYGDGVGRRRWRNTQLNIPPLLEQNLEAANDQPSTTGLNQRAKLVNYG